MGYYDEVDEVGWKAVKWFIIFTLLFSVIGGIGWCARSAVYPVEQMQKVVERTLGADNVIYNYEWFHQRYADWLAAGSNAEAKQKELNMMLSLSGPMNAWSVHVQREINQLRVELSGLRAHRVNIANEYNAHVGMGNRNLFRDRNLPEHLTE